MKILPIGEIAGPPSRELAGARFGKLVAKRVVGRTTGRHYVWECSCDCGATLNVSRPALARQKSCGCVAPDPLEAGQRFGALALVSAEHVPNGRGWKCACDCGGSNIYRESDIRRGRRLSCGTCVATRRARGVGLCSVCRLEKPIADFNARHDRSSGTQSHCRVCDQRRNSEFYRRDIDSSRARRRESFRRDPRGSERLIENQKRNPAKHAAQMRVYNAVKRGTLVRPAICSRCPETHRIEGHHDDYGKPLDVMWLCTACHRARHRELRELGIDPEASTRPERKVA